VTETQQGCLAVTKYDSKKFVKINQYLVTIWKKYSERIPGQICDSVPRWNQDKTEGPENIQKYNYIHTAVYIRNIKIIYMCISLYQSYHIVDLKQQNHLKVGTDKLKLPTLKVVK